MFRPNTAIILLLLALMAGNLACIGVNKSEVEAVAEWRVEGELQGSDWGDESVSAVSALFRETVVFVPVPVTLSHRQCRFNAESNVTQATRAPPSATA